MEFCERKFIEERGKEKEKFKKRFEKLNPGVKRNYNSLSLQALFIPIFYHHLATYFTKIIEKQFSI